MIKLIANILLSLTLLGCATINEQTNNGNETTNITGIKNINFFGSGLEKRTNYTYTQFNEKYAITAKHTEKENKVVWVCEDCDLVFFERAENGFKNEDYWEIVKPFSDLKLYGYVGIYIKELEGKDLATVGAIDNIVVGNLMTITPIKGMSGGPVVSENNKIVGMNIGYEGSTKRGIYIPYAKILEEYQKFQNSL